MEPKKTKKTSSDKENLTNDRQISCKARNNYGNSLYDVDNGGNAVPKNKRLGFRQIPFNKQWRQYKMVQI